MNYDENEKAIQLSRQMLDSLHGVRIGKAKAEQMNTSLITWLGEFIRSDESRERGSIFCELARLPGTRWSVIYEVLSDTGPYQMHGMRLLVTVKNTSTKTIPVESGYRWIAKPAKHGSAYVDGDTGRGVPLYTDLAPGGTIRLTPHFALLNLRRHSQAVWDPDIWETSGAIPQRNDLTEVGFSCDFDGQPYIVEPPAEKRKRAVA